MSTPDEVQNGSAGASSASNDAPSADAVTSTKAGPLYHCVFCSFADDRPAAVSRHFANEHADERDIYAVSDEIISPAELQYAARSVIFELSRRLTLSRRAAPVMSFAIPVRRAVCLAMFIGIGSLSYNASCDRLKWTLQDVQSLTRLLASTSQLTAPFTVSFRMGTKCRVAAPVHIVSGPCKSRNGTGWNEYLYVKFAMHYDAPAVPIEKPSEAESESCVITSDSQPEPVQDQQQPSPHAEPVSTSAPLVPAEVVALQPVVRKPVWDPAVLRRRQAMTSSGVDAFLQSLS